MKQKRICPVCNTPYLADVERLKFGRQTTCSRKCSYALRAKDRTILVKTYCANCNKEIERNPNSINECKHGAVYCSPKCQYEGRTKGFTKRIVVKPYNMTEEGKKTLRTRINKIRNERILLGTMKHTEATKAKLSEATAKAISNGTIKKRSLLEDRVGEYMREKNIDFIPQHVIRDIKGRYSCSFDFFFPSRNMALEVNGTFWHSDPRYYTNGPVHKVQKQNAVKWQNKINIAKNHNIEVRSVWEHDLNLDFDNTINNAIA